MIFFTKVKKLWKIGILNKSKKGVKANGGRPCGSVIVEYKDKVMITGTTVKSHEYIYPN